MHLEYIAAAATRGTPRFRFSREASFSQEESQRPTVILPPRTGVHITQLGA